MNVHYYSQSLEAIQIGFYTKVQNKDNSFKQQNQSNSTDSTCHEDMYKPQSFNPYSIHIIAEIDQKNLETLKQSQSYLQNQEISPKGKSSSQPICIDKQKQNETISSSQLEQYTHIVNRQEAKKLFCKAKKLIKERKFEEALLVLTQAVKRYPEDTKFRLNLAILYMKLGIFNRAMEELQAVIESDPYNAEAYWRKGDCLCALQRFYQAKDCYKQGLKLKPLDEACITGINRSSLGIFNTSCSSFSINQQILPAIMKSIDSHNKQAKNFTNQELDQISILIKKGKVKIIS